MDQPLHTTLLGNASSPAPQQHKWPYIKGRLEVKHKLPNMLTVRVRLYSRLMGNTRWVVTSEGVLRLSLLLITPLMPTFGQPSTHSCCRAAQAKQGC
jgi:hypothetical protein